MPVNCGGRRERIASMIKSAFRRILNFYLRNERHLHIVKATLVVEPVEGVNL